MDVPLGPEIGQCCGGRVALGFKRVNRGLAEELVAKVDAEIATRPHVYVLVQAMSVTLWLMRAR